MDSLILLIVVIPLLPLIGYFAIYFLQHRYDRY